MVASIYVFSVAICAVCSITAMLDVCINGGRYADWAPYGFGLAAAFGLIAWLMLPASAQYINGPGVTRNPCAELARYIGSENNGIRLTSISGCKVRGRQISGYVTGTIQ